jgi:hypothetical protein
MYCHLALDAEDKRQMRRLYPAVVFDGKEIARQLAEKREACRCYRSRRRSSARLRHVRQPLYAVFDPAPRAVYADIPTTAEDAAALLDAILSLDRTLNDGTAPTYERRGHHAVLDGRKKARC